MLRAHDIGSYYLGSLSSLSIIPSDCYSFARPNFSITHYGPPEIYLYGHYAYERARVVRDGGWCRLSKWTKGDLPTQRCLWNFTKDRCKGSGRMVGLVGVWHKVDRGC